MLAIDSYEKENLKVLGLLVRYRRVNLGLSLRDLGELTNISHTLISNFERGVMIPHYETIKDIFEVLKLEFYDHHLILDDFSNVYNKVFKHLLYHEYEEAAEIIYEIEKDRHIYENSREVINFTVIRCLFYILTNTFINEKDKVLNEYEVVLEFFTDNQKQMFYFIKGLDKLNQEFYKEAMDYFKKALHIGNSDVDLLINEYYVIALSKSNMFIVSRDIARDCIVAYEQQTNYIRAMLLRTRIANDLMRIKKYDEAKKIYNYIYNFSIKYNIKDLENICNTRLSYIALLQNEYDIIEKYLDKATPGNDTLYYYMKFDIMARKKDKEGIIKLYNKYMQIDWIKNHRKTSNFFKLILMRNCEEYMDKKEYERIHLEQIDIAIRSDDAEMFEVTTKFLMKFYKSERQYKKGFLLSEKFLQYFLLEQL